MTAEVEQRAGVSDPDFELFCELIYAATGMRFGAHKRYFVDKRLLERSALTGKRSVRDYLRDLRLEPRSAEMQILVESMTVNETYFFREAEQLDRVVREVLPQLCARRGDGQEVRIWSIPCSSGEEAYTLAIKLLEDWPDVDRYDVSIFGSDIDSNMVRKAREGLYSERSMHRVPPDLRKRYFRRVGAESRVIDQLRKSIDFGTVNVLDRDQMRAYRNMDVIICRNMLIYFDEASRRKTVDAFYDALRPGGALLFGASEGLAQSTRHFDVERVRGAPVYLKPMAARGRE